MDKTEVEGIGNDLFELINGDWDVRVGPSLHDEQGRDLVNGIQPL